MENLLKRIVDYIVYVTDPEEIILFGSVAMGTNNSYSDIDLLIISKNTYHRGKITQDISGFISQLGFQSDIIFLKPTELLQELNNPMSLLFNALKEQNKIYEKQI